MKLLRGCSLLEEGGNLTRLKEFKKLTVLMKLKIHTHKVMKVVNNCWGDLLKLCRNAGLGSHHQF